jgi:hypothetical protein
MVNASPKTKCVFEKELTKIFPQNPLLKATAPAVLLRAKALKSKIKPSHACMHARERLFPKLRKNAKRALCCFLASERRAV